MRKDVSADQTLKGWANCLSEHLIECPQTHNSFLEQIQVAEIGVLCVEEEQGCPASDETSGWEVSHLYSFTFTHV